MTNELAIRVLTGDVLGTSEQTQEAVKIAVEALLRPSAQPEQRWIPCGERLPENSNFYIVTRKDFLVKFVWYSVLHG